MALGMALGMEVVVVEGSDGRAGGRSARCGMVACMVLVVVVVVVVQQGG